MPPSNAYIGKTKMNEIYKKKFSDYTLIDNKKKGDGLEQQK